MTDLASRIEPYVLLARSTKGAAAAKVIEDATSATGVYVFSELLEVPNIQELAGSAYDGHYQLLRLFAYGTLANCDVNAGTTGQGALTVGNQGVNLASLNISQLAKLKHLTLVSAAQKHRSLPFDQLLTTLRLEDIRQLEDLIIDVMYAGLLGGKIHHHEGILHVDWIAGRDVGDDDLAGLQEALTNWCATASTLLTALDMQIDAVRKTSATEAQYHTAYKAQRDSAYYAVASDQRSQYSGGEIGGRSGLGTGGSKGGGARPEGFGGVGRFGNDQVGRGPLSTKAKRVRA